MSADPALVAALGTNGACPFAAFTFELPGRTLRLLDGSARIVIAGESYTADDETFGMLAAIEPVSEAMDGEAPELRFVFHPADAAAAVDLANPAMQGSRVTVMIGCLDLATGLPIGTPEVIGLFEVDVPTVVVGEGSRQVEFTAVSVFERLFEVDEGERATDGFHQSIWPGELGLDGVTGTTEKLHWGSKAAVAGGGLPYVDPRGDPRTNVAYWTYG